MKRRTKLGLALVATGFGVAALSSCTASFCSGIDVSRMKYAFEPGIIRIEKSDVSTDKIVFHGQTNDYTIEGAKLVTAQWVPAGNDMHVGNFVFDKDGENKKELTFLNGIIKSARDSGVKAIDGSTVEYMQRFDFLALNTIFGKVAFVFAIVALSAVLVSVICMLCFRRENNF